MPKLFISYRRENDPHCQRVRALAERLRDNLQPRGIEVSLDEFLIDQKPGGPAEGLQLWSANQVREAGRVIIIGSTGWMDCFLGRTNQGPGAGVAGEAQIIRAEMNKGHYKTDKFRVCVFHPSEKDAIPGELSTYYAFVFPQDEERLLAWIAEIAPTPQTVTIAPSSALTWPAARRDTSRPLADREAVFQFFQRLLAGQTGDQRILLIRAETNHGKSTLIEKFHEYAENLLPCGFLNFKGSPGEEEFLRNLNREFKAHFAEWRTSPPQTLGEALERLEETAQSRPLLVLIDTYEQGAPELLTRLERECWAAVRRAPGLCLVVSGQKVPTEWEKSHQDRWVKCETLGALTRLEDWESWANQRYPTLNRHHIEALVLNCGGVPGSVAAALEMVGATLGRRATR